MVYEIRKIKTNKNNHRKNVKLANYLALDSSLKEQCLVKYLKPEKP